MICIYIDTYGHIFVYVHVVCACHRDVSIYASFGLENHVRLLSNVICQTFPLTFGNQTWLGNVPKNEVFFTRILHCHL